MEVISRIWRLYETRVGIELLGQLKIQIQTKFALDDADLVAIYM